MNKIRKLFSPSALAATVATGMLLHTTVALACQACLSQTALDSLQFDGCNNPNFPDAVSGYGGSELVWWCCPYGIPGDPTVTGGPPYPYIGWCECPN